MKGSATRPRPTAARSTIPVTPGNLSICIGIYHFFESLSKQFVDNINYINNGRRKRGAGPPPPLKRDTYLALSKITVPNNFNIQMALQKQQKF